MSLSTPACLPCGPVSLDRLLQLRPGRAHEFCGPARHLLAAWMVARLPAGAPVIWIRPRWGVDRLCPLGLRDWASPEGLIFVEPARASDCLGCAEEALRSGAVGLVVVEQPDPPALTPLRRLHLAAETGLARRRGDSRAVRSAEGLHALVLTAGTGGTAGVESRWHLAPCPATDAPGHAPVQPAWRLHRLRARMAPPAAWRITAQLQAIPCKTDET